MASNSVCPASASRCSRAGRRRGGMQRLLYYPLVNPPTPIVWQGLLYWDGIASIVPWEGDYLQPLLRELHDTPLYEALEADNLSLSAQATSHRLRSPCPSGRQPAVLAGGGGRGAARAGVEHPAREGAEVPRRLLG